MRIFSLFILMCALPVWAGDFANWSVTPVLGMHNPSVAHINQGVFKSPLVLNARDGTGNSSGSQNLPFKEFPYSNPLPAMQAGGEAGVEFQWRMNRKNAYIFGLSAWESGSSASQEDMIFQIQFIPYIADSFREAKLSYTQFYLGWRRDIISAKRFKLYLGTTLHELFDIDYTEKFRFIIKEPFVDAANLPDEPITAGVQKILIMRTQATGALALNLSLGSEYYLTKWFSVGFNGGYFYSLNRVLAKDFRVDTDLRDPSDGIQRDSDQIIGPLAQHPTDQNVSYYLIGGGERDLTLEFHGWRASLRFNFHF